MSCYSRKNTRIKHIFIYLLGIILLCLPPYASVQGIPATDKSGGIVIVPTLDKYRNIRQLKEKDFGGYIMVYFKGSSQEFVGQLWHLKLPQAMVKGQFECLSSAIPECPVANGFCFVIECFHCAIVD